MFDPTSPFSAKSDPLQPTQKTGFAEERLRGAVQSCELAPGSVATEAQLAERFGLGRAAVRVALARLSALGLVHPIPRAGWKVLPVTGALIGEVIAARRQMEPCLALARPSAAQIDQITNLAERIEALEGQTAPEVRTTRNNCTRELLDTLAYATDNRLMADFLSRLWDHSARILRFLEADDAPLAARALAEAVAAGNRDAIITLRLADIDAFRTRATEGLLSDLTELGPQAAERHHAPETTQKARQRPERTEHSKEARSSGPKTGP